MAEVHTVHSVIAQIEHLLRAKSGRLVLVSPYTRPSPNIRDRLAHAAKQRDTPIQLVVRANELKPEELEAIGTIPGVELRLVSKLHAKCYCSDDVVIITSLNLLESSESNYELGVSLRRDSDPDGFAAAWSEIELLLDRSQSYVPPRKPKPEVRPASSSFSSQGVCIRCRTQVPLDASRPLCYSCWEGWNAFGNPDYVERFCHACRREGQTTVGRPLCPSCWRAA